MTKDEAEAKKDFEEAEVLAGAAYEETTAARKTYEEETPTEVKKKEPRKWWEWPFRVIQTRGPGPNMPKFQPCPKCLRPSKRKNKTLTGASYFCRSDRESYLVVAPCFSSGRWSASAKVTPARRLISASKA